jgi:hypothetical protein
VLDYTEMKAGKYVAAGNDRLDLVVDCVRREHMLDGQHSVANDGGCAWKQSRVRSIWLVIEARGGELDHVRKAFENGMQRVTVGSLWKLEGFRGFLLSWQVDTQGGKWCPR